MSGRLVILKHKSWNVWNQDNREKVLRDERLHKEEVEKEKSSQRLSSQEKLRETLLSKNSDLSVTDITSTKFKDNSKQSENPEYVKERKEKEDKLKRQQGVAPWSFSELTKSSPWYLKLDSNHYDIKKKDKDPTYPPTDALAIAQSSSSKKKNDETNKLTVSPIDEDIYIKLRQKRLEREKNERHKAQVMLAEYDIFGSHTAVSDKTDRNYIEEYHIVNKKRKK